METCWRCGHEALSMNGTCCLCSYHPSMMSRDNDPPWGKMPVSAHGGWKYLLWVVQDHLKHLQKSEAKLYAQEKAVEPALSELRKRIKLVLIECPKEDPPA